jgi:hypothetical protein
MEKTGIVEANLMEISEEIWWVLLRIGRLNDEFEGGKKKNVCFLGKS